MITLKPQNAFENYSENSSNFHNFFLQQNLVSREMNKIRFHVILFLTPSDTPHLPFLPLSLPLTGTFFVLEVRTMLLIEEPTDPYLCSRYIYQFHNAKTHAFGDLPQRKISYEMKSLNVVK